MMMSWSISGVPRTIHTTVRVSQRRGRNRVMEPKEMISPRGMAPRSVTPKSCRVFRKPWFSAPRTVANTARYWAISAASMP